MKEKPILFNGAMVRALIEGRKNMTRRIVKGLTETSNISMRDDGSFLHAKWPRCERNMQNFGRCEDLHCPYDGRLWVKETHWLFGRWYRNGLTKTGRPRWRFRADKLHRHAAFTPPHVIPKRTSKGWHKRTSLFMPRWASRITLEITNVRVERVQDISEEDAIAEGCEMNGVFPKEQPDPSGIGDRGWDSAVEWYSDLWDDINGKTYPWDSNPWVWVIAFRKL